MLLGGRLRAEASLYQMIGKNEIISVELANGARVNRNAGKTRHVGVEYALTYRPTTAWSFRLSGTNAHHTFLQYEERGQTLDGNEMSGAPDWIAHAEAVYRPPFIEGARVALEWQHVGPYYMDAENTLRYEGYDLLGLRLGYRFRSFELWANVYNLTDALYATVANKSPWGQRYNLGPPRRVTVGVRYHFGSDRP